MWLRTLTFGTILALLVTLVAACTLTVGLHGWCGSFPVARSEMPTTLASTAAIPSSTVTTTITPVPSTTPAPNASTTLPSTTFPSTTTIATTTTSIAILPTQPISTTLLTNDTQMSSTAVLPVSASTGSTSVASARRRKRAGDASPTSASYQYPTCENAEPYNVNWTYYSKSTDSTPRNVLDPGKYYYYYEAAESSCWVCVVFWMIQLFFYLRRLIKSCRQNQQNTYQDPFNTEDAFDVFT